MAHKPVTDMSKLHVTHPSKITVKRGTSNDSTTVLTVVGIVVSHGRSLRADGSIRSWVVLGNDTTREPSIEWLEDRYHEVSIEDVD